MMKRKCLLFWIGFFCCVSANAQISTSLFQPLDWEQASSLAAQKGKLVLVEVGNVSGNLEKQLKGQGDLLYFLQQHVVAIQMDMDTKAGEKFESRLLLHKWPIYAFFMPYGDLLTVIPPEEVMDNPTRLRDILHDAQKLAQLKRSNSRSVHFSNIELSQACSNAIKEGKNILIYYRNSTQQASLLMEKNVLNLDTVADFFNQHFICLYREQGDRDSLVLKYKIKDEPAFLFLNANGKLLYHATGFLEAKQIIDFGEKALQKAQGIPFETQITEQILKRSEQSGKLIFIDHYTIGNTHKELLQTVYSDPEVTDFFTKHFINVSQENGSSFLQFTDANGKELHRLIHVKDAADLLEQAHRVLSKRGTSHLKEEYNQGNREISFIKEYMSVLERAGHNKELSNVVMAYFQPLTPKCLKDKKHWEWFERYVKHTTPDFLEYVLKQKSELASLHGEERVNKQIEILWTYGTEDFIKDGRLDEISFKKYIKLLKSNKIHEWRKIVRDSRIAIAAKTGDWKTFVAQGEEKWNTEKGADSELYHWGMEVHEHCKNIDLRYKTAHYIMKRVIELKRQEQIAGRVKMDSYRGFLEKLANDLLHE